MIFYSLIFIILILLILLLIKFFKRNESFENDNIKFKDIKKLFTKYDRDSMLWMFDLWKYEDVKNNAKSIYLVVKDGSMPCYEQWKERKVKKFKKWMDINYPK